MIRFAPATRALAVTAVILTVVGVVASPAVATTGAETGLGSSALTVDWAGDTSRAAGLQPDRQATSLSGEPEGDEITNPHYADFENLSVTVSQTQGLGDGPITLDVTGMPGGSTGSDRALPGFRNGAPSFLQQNFLQVMQCWGDPSSADFRQTCEYGVTYRGGGGEDLVTLGTDRGQAPFTAVTGVDYVNVAFDNLPPGALSYHALTSPSSTNENPGVPIQPDGSAEFVFEVQTFRQSPHLGCGQALEDGTSRSCSLVVVPRGTIYGGTAQIGSGTRTIGYGQFGLQSGSPMSRTHDYWDNRIVIPLEFAPASASCGGGTSQLVSGSQLMIAAMGSWQQGLCAQGANYSFAPAGDAPTRARAVGSGDLAFTSRPATAEDTSADILDDVVYAPVAVSGLTVAIRMQDTSLTVTDVKLSPLLLAKLLTQHYRGSVPGEYPTAGALWPHRDEAAPNLAFDPEFTRLNPGIPYRTQLVADLVVAGPIAADAYALLWDYLQADDAARAYLGGEPDTNGLTANPYYLPSGHPAAVGPVMDEVDGTMPGSLLLKERTRADGSALRVDVGLTGDDGEPMSLATADLDVIPRPDVALAPLQIEPAGGGAAPRSRFDTLTFNPYATGFDQVATRVFRGDPSRASWNASARVSDSELGAWSSRESRQSLGTGYAIGGLTDSASAAEWALTTVHLQVPNGDTFVSADTTGMTAALSAQTTDAETGTTWTDMAALPADAYPLTLVTYAMVDLAGTDATERETYASFLEYAVGAGQVPGTNPGQLPEGYVPLTESQRAQTTAAIATIRAYTEPTEEPDDGDGGTEPPAAAPAGANPAPPAAAAGADADAAAVAPATDITTADTPDAETAVTAGAQTGSSSVVGLALALGVLGAILSPFLLRRRSTG